MTYRTPLGLIAALLTLIVVAACARPSGAVQWPTELPSNQQELQQLRSQLQQNLWGSEGVPAMTAEVSSSNAAQALLPPEVAKVAGTVELLTVPLRFGLSSKVRLIEPERLRQCSLVVVGGHAPIWEGLANVVVAEALAKGCSTALVEMPGHGLNGEQIAVRPDGVRLQLNEQNGNHDNYRMLESAGRPVMDVFVDPVIAATQYLRKSNGSSPVLTGLSGGALLVILAAAADPEIRSSLSVAGFGNSTGVDDCRDDYEQCAREFYRTVSPSQLRVMASAPAGREHVDQFNRSDICCFAFPVEPAWAEPIAESASELGGRYELQLYNMPGHSYSPESLQLLASMLGET